MPSPYYYNAVCSFCQESTWRNSKVASRAMDRARRKNKNKYYKLKIKTTEVLSVNDWWYMGCKVCWKKLKGDDNGAYRCSGCPDADPWPRYKISVRAIDAEAENETDATFAEFIFFGAQGEQITGITADCAAAHATGRTDYLPPELEQLPGKKFIVTVTPQEKSLDAVFYYLQVKATEHLKNQEQLPLLPIINAPLAVDTAGSSSSTIPVNDPADKAIAATPPSSEHATHESPSLKAKQDESSNDKATLENKKRSADNEAATGSKSRKKSAKNELFASGTSEGDAANLQTK